ncbi:MAG: YaeQ family protein [Pseudomonadales bacterium]|nr:YaeQ family protein [Pseudomonadales bacterium]NRA14147.1 YaeQ family protein [Oceanospirillaceae bacterium]
MALKPTLYKVDLQLVDTDRNVYDNCKFTIAQHPSETQIRMMIRLMVFSLNYHSDLQFTKGLSSQDEPDLWQISPSLEVQSWISVGQASAERMRKGISRSPKVILYAYGSETDIWWQKAEAAYRALPHIEVFKFDHKQAAKLEQFVERKMQLTVSISAGEIYLTSDAQDLSLSLSKLL